MKLQVKLRLYNRGLGKNSFFLPAFFEGFFKPSRLTSQKQVPGLKLIHDFCLFFNVYAFSTKYQNTSIRQIFLLILLENMNVLQVKKH